jgi:hypothetical protein
MEKIALTDLKAALQRLEAEKEQRTSRKTNPAEWVEIGDDLVIRTGVPRAPSGMSASPSPEAPSPAGRNQPEAPQATRRDCVAILPAPVPDRRHQPSRGQANAVRAAEQSR